MSLGTADFNGPVGVTFARVPQARYTHRSNALEISASVEEANGSGSSDPVATTAMFYKGDNFSARIAGLVGTFDSDGENLNTNALTLSDSYKKLSPGVAYGQANYDGLTNTGTIDFDELQSVFVNAFYSPVNNLTFAAEYSQGRREGSSGTDSADRIGSSVTYSF